MGREGLIQSGTANIHNCQTKNVSKSGTFEDQPLLFICNEIILTNQSLFKHMH